MGYSLHDSNLKIAGVDEAGRGPLAGPVVAAAVILDPTATINGLADSKTLTPGKRQKLADEIKAHALSWGIGRVSHEKIDSMNILQASLLAMKLAIEELPEKPELVLVDGNKCPSVSYRIDAIIGGDKRVPSISAASILAKVYRDTEMVQMDELYPGYGFAKHKGYPTKDHLAALEKLGICKIHRRSFSPVQRVLECNDN
ncbi:MAG: ribonuclease HII [Gammaproteobacteria bacterium]|nr:ribonuclease HII [Gammaproteobacteria bacterium]